MTSSIYEQDTIRLYLLGKLAGEPLEEFERRLLTDDQLFEELLATEDELIDDFLIGDLSKEETAMFEKHFLVTDERREKLRFGQAVRKYARVNRAEATNTVIEAPQPGFIPSSIVPAQSPALLSWPHFFSSPQVRATALAALMLITIFAVWRIAFYQSDVDKGLLALNRAYRNQRPVEARISQLDYAPFVTTRGPGSDKINESELRLAELTLLEAQKKKPTSASYHGLGKVYLAKREFDRAIEQFEQALKLDPNNAAIYADLGAVYLEKGRVEIETGSVKNSSESGKGFEDLGRSLNNLNKALELDHTLLEALFNRPLAEQLLTLYDQAEQHWREYLKRESTSPWAEEARRYLKLLEERKSKSSGTKEQLIKDFVTAFETQNDEAAWGSISRGRARAGNLIVEALLDDFLNLALSGRRGEADQKLRMLYYGGTIEERRVGERFTSTLARVYAAATPTQHEIFARARGLMKSANELYIKSEYQQAIDLYTKARDLFVRTGNEAEALFADAWVGYCYLRLQEPDKSVPIFERLFATFEANNYSSLLAQSLLASADAQLSTNEYSKALEFANQSLAVSKEIHDTVNTVRCLQAGTTIQLIFGDYHKSLDAAYRALNLAETIPPDAKLTWPFYHEASFDFYFLGLPDVALKFENEALRLATSAGLSLQASRSYDRLALLHGRMGNYEEAIKNSEQTRAVGQTITDEKTRTNILAHSALNLAKLHRESGAFRRAIDYYDESLELYEKANLGIYKYEAHKGKLLSLLELNDDAAAEAELNSTLYWFELNREKIAQESFKNKFFDTDQNTYDVAVDFEFSRKKNTTRALQYAENSRGRSLFDLMIKGGKIAGDANNPEITLDPATNTPLKVEEIQKRLPEEVQLLQYSVLKDKVAIWVVTKKELQSTDAKIDREELDKRIREFVRALSSSDQNTAERAAKDLYTSLITPAERLLSRDLQLCIIPDKNLNLVPFGALVSPSSGRYLIQDFAIEIAPSATVFIFSSDYSKQREGSKTEQVLAVGDPTFDRVQFNDLPYLPAARREVQEISRLYATAPLLGDAALATSVKQQLKDADVVHLATHAIADERSPLLSKLLLSKNDPGDRNLHHPLPGFLQASEIYGMKLPRTRLVVLSACQTGVERLYRGEGAIGLARPFIAAGVPVVVASLWPVESDATADLMISFYKHRKQDRVSTVEALRRAQLDMIHNQRPGSPKNYGWAAFVTIGGYASF